MIINDAVFGEIEYTYGWIKELTLNFVEKKLK